VLKIAIVGAESTGKSDLAQKLATHFKTIWVKEYARQYLEHQVGKYGYEDILVIAQKQHQKVQETIENNTDKPIIFVDTELLVTKIWAEYVFGKCHPWILDTLPKQTYDYYLLTNIDLPWQADPLREHPEPQKRQELHSLYKANLEVLQFPYNQIDGLGETRTKQAIQVVEALMAKQ